MFPTAAYGPGGRSRVTGSTLRERRCGALDGNSQKSAIKLLKKKKKNKRPHAVSSCGRISAPETPPCFGLHIRPVRVWTSRYVRILTNQPNRWVWRRSKRMNVETPRTPNPLRPPSAFYLTPSEGSSVTLIRPEDPEASCQGAVCGALAVD